MRSSTRSSNSTRLKYALARSGETYASVGSVHLNSPYDPKREAERLVEKKTRDRPPDAVLILGDTLPYLREAIRVRHPKAKIISIYFHSGFPAAAVKRFAASSPPGHYWSPGHPSNLQSYLRTELSQIDVTALVVIEWPPSVTAFPELAAEASLAVAQIVREVAAEFATEAAFSRTWLHNLFANFLLTDSWYSLRAHNRPVVIAASGPSLSRTIPLLSEQRSKVYLIALPSSLVALRVAGVRPDLVVNVDGGYWAQHHLGALAGDPTTPVAMPLIAARGIWRRPTAPVLLSAGSYIERVLIERSGIVPFGVVATGTVAASAYELSTLLSEGPVIFAGLDLCNEDLIEHVRPHTFDTHLELLTTRTAPMPTVLTDRLFRSGARNWATGVCRTPALETYAGWFRSTRSGRPPYRLLPSAVTLEGFRELDAHRFAALLHGIPSSPPAGRLEALKQPAAAERRAILAGLLATWEERLQRVHRTVATAYPFPPVAVASGRELPEAELLWSLEPTGYQRYRRALRCEPGASPSKFAEELLEKAHTTIATLRRRYLS